MSDLDLRHLPRPAQFDQAHARLEDLLRELLLAGMRADDLCNAARTTVALLEPLERDPVAREAFRAGAPLDAIKQRRRR